MTVRCEQTALTEADPGPELIEFLGFFAEEQQNWSNPLELLEMDFPLVDPSEAKEKDDE